MPTVYGFYLSDLITNEWLSDDDRLPYVVFFYAPDNHLTFSQMIIF